MIIVSACLVGRKCRYDGSDNKNENVIQRLKDIKYYEVCPEELGGLSTPRTPCEIRDERVLSKFGEDFTQEFETGAKTVLALALMHHVKLAVLKSKSPSCGCGLIYDGTFTKTLTKGDGVCAKLLKEHGINVINETDELDL